VRYNSSYLISIARARIVVLVSIIVQALCVFINLGDKTRKDYIANAASIMFFRNLALTFNPCASLRIIFERES
jgi:hypothetical protein